MVKSVHCKRTVREKGGGSIPPTPSTAVRRTGCCVIVLKVPMIMVSDLGVETAPALPSSFGFPPFGA